LKEISQFVRKNEEIKKKQDNAENHEIEEQKFQVGEPEIYMEINTETYFKVVIENFTLLRHHI